MEQATSRTWLRALAVLEFLWNRRVFQGISIWSQQGRGLAKTWSSKGRRGRHSRASSGFLLPDTAPIYLAWKAATAQHDLGHRVLGSSCQDLTSWGPSVSPCHRTGRFLHLTESKSRFHLVFLLCVLHLRHLGFNCWVCDQIKHCSICWSSLSSALIASLKPHHILTGFKPLTKCFSIRQFAKVNFIWTILKCSDCK